MTVFNADARVDQDGAGIGELGGAGLIAAGKTSFAGQGGRGGVCGGGADPGDCWATMCWMCARAVQGPGRAAAADP
jgi:hypothetical protein